MNLKKTFRILFIFTLTMITINMTYAQPNPCDCDFIFEPVCVEDADGNVLPFPNSCIAECEGFTAADFVDCDFGGGVDTTIVDPCNCGFDITPVCVEDADGNILPFPNACYAECEGFTATDFVDCDFGGGVDTTIVTDTCGCDFTLDFVCVNDGNGNVIPFPNACYAECEGFTAADFVSCDSIIWNPMDDCYASFWYDYDFTNPLSVQFTDYSSTATSWAWDFGDGNTSTEQNPLHVYSEEGVYDVTLTIAGDSCTSTITEHICILSVDPTPDCDAFFYSSTPDWDAPLTVQFNDLSLNATSWTWDFGDGNTSAEQNPLHAYIDEGVYDVSLTIANDSCSSTYIDHICVFNGGVIDTTIVDPCGCGFEFDPVCVEDVDGNILPFPSPCYAECEGFTAADFVDCDFGGGVDTTIVDPCNCGFDFEPVCVEDADGNIFPFPNACIAECEGFTATDFVDCDFGGGIDTTIVDPCNCGFDFEPVCVEDVDGNVLPFPNACIAECEGFTAADFVDCDFGGGIDTTIVDPCGCGFDIEPVCVEDADGNIFPFPNACYAECEGYTTADFVDCEFFVTDPNLIQVVSTFTDLLTYPNPAIDFLNLDLLSTIDKELMINIQNIAGITVSSVSRQMYVGKNKFQLDVSSLQSGMYFIQLDNGVEIKTIKFMK